MIREIATAIKELLDSFNEVASKNADLIEKKKGELENFKREFVRTSKAFSDNLKKFFKDGKYVENEETSRWRNAYVNSRFS